MTIWVALVVSFCLLVVNGFFVALEFSLVGSRRTKLEERADGGTRSDRLAVEASGDITMQLAGAQLGITMASLALGLVAEPKIAGLIEPVMAAVHLPPAAGHTIAAILSLAFVVFLHMVLGEMVPKSIALADPEHTLRRIVLANRAYLFVFRPVIRILNWMSNVVVRAFGIQPRDSLSSTPTAAELTVMLTASRDEGLIEDAEHGILTGVLDFGGRDAAAVMIGRDDIHAITNETTVREAESLAVRCGHSRLPVHGPGGIDDIRGFVHVKDLLMLGPETADSPVPIRLARRMLVVPCDRALQDLLLAMQRARVHFALVTDPTGGTAGIVTLEDLLEEIVGEILDEFDPEAD